MLNTKKPRIVCESNAANIYVKLAPQTNDKYGKIQRVKNTKCNGDKWCGLTHYVLNTLTMRKHYNILIS